MILKILSKITPLVIHFCFWNMRGILVKFSSLELLQVTKVNTLILEQFLKKDYMQNVIQVKKQCSYMIRIWELKMSFQAHKKYRWIEKREKVQIVKFRKRTGRSHGVHILLPGIREAIKYNNQIKTKLKKQQLTYILASDILPVESQLEWTWKCTACVAS